MIEADPNPFPKFEILPQLERAAQFVTRLFHFLPEQPLASHGDHLPNTGAAQMLDEHLSER